MITRTHQDNKLVSPCTSLHRTISVCMASYNGQRFILRQLRSILSQLGERDEVVIVDDGSSDGTFSVINQIHDSRIRVIRNQVNQGVIRAFERALSNARNEIIFLSDQDDEWYPNKAMRFLKIFDESPDITLILSDAIVIDDKGVKISDSWFKRRRFAPGVISNLIKNRYLGCTMALRRSVLHYILPFPSDIPMHDMWIGILNQIFGNTVYIPEPLMAYRRHDGNVTNTTHAPVAQMIHWRILLAKNLFLRYVSQRRSVIDPCI